MHRHRTGWRRAVPTASGFTLKGSSKGYTSFSKAFGATKSVFYSAHDDKGNREAGVATFDGSNLVDRFPTATLVAGIYSQNSPSKVQFSGQRRGCVYVQRIRVQHALGGL